MSLPDEELREPVSHILPLLVSAGLCLAAGRKPDMDEIVFALEIGGIVGIVLSEWILFMHRQVRCTVLKSTLSFLILLLACKCLGEALATGEFSFPVFWKGLILLGIWNRYCWYIPWVIRKRAGMRTASSR